MIKLWNYQRPLVRGVLEDIRAGKPEIGLCAAPGSGKTEMALEIIRRALDENLTARVLVLAHGTRVLRRQFAKRAIKALGSGVVAQYVPMGDPLDEHVPLSKIRQRVVVALPQSLHDRDLKRFKLVIVDEAHEFYGAEMSNRILREARARSTVLLTGSPSKLIARGVPMHMIALNEVHASMPEALSNPTVETVSSDYLIDFDRYDEQSGEVRKDVRFAKHDTEVTLDRLLKRLILHLSERETRGWRLALERLGKTMIVCRSQELARQVADYFRERDVAAELSTSEDDPDAAAIRSFTDSRDCRLLIVVRRANIGFNYPELVNLVDMTGTINIDRIFQMYCRLVRPCKGVRKRFVKLTARGPMENYTVAVTRAALRLSEPEIFSTFNGRNLDGIRVPMLKEEETEREGGGAGAPRPGAPPALDDGFFLTDDFFEVMKDIDRDPEFCRYAWTDLGRVRDKARGRESAEARQARMLREYEGLWDRLGRQPSRYAKDPEERRLGIWAYEELKKLGVPEGQKIGARAA